VQSEDIIQLPDIGTEQVENCGITGLFSSISAKILSKLVEKKMTIPKIKT